MLLKPTAAPNINSEANKQGALKRDFHVPPRILEVGGILLNFGCGCTLQVLVVYPGGAVLGTEQVYCARCSKFLFKIPHHPSHEGR